MEQTLHFFGVRQEDSTLILLIVTNIVQKTHAQIVQALISRPQSIQIRVGINGSIGKEKTVDEAYPLQIQETAHSTHSP